MADPSDSHIHSNQSSSSHNLPLNRLPERSFGLQAKSEIRRKEVETQGDRPRSFGHDFTTTPFLQPKLTVGAVDDPYEQEADRVAAEVVQRINQHLHGFNIKKDYAIANLS